jgi:hypothetical protein
MTFSFIGLTLAKVKELSTAVFSHLTAAQMSELSRKQAAVLTAAQIDAIDNSAFVGFSEAALGGLSRTAMEAISASTATSFTGKQFAEIAPASLAAMSLACFAALGKREVSDFNAAQIEAMSPAEIAALAPATFLGLSAKALAAISATQAAALTSEQIADFGAVQLNNLSVAALNAAPLSRLTPIQIEALSIKTIGEFSTAQFAAALGGNLQWLTAKQVASLTALQKQVAGLTIQEIASLTPTEVEALSPSTIAALSPEQFDALPPSAIAELLFFQWLAVTSAQISGLTQAQLQELNIFWLSGSVIAGLSNATLDEFTAQQFRTFLDDDSQYLTAAQINGFSLAQLGQLGDFDIVRLSTKTIAGLTDATLDEFTAGQFEGFGVEQINGLTTQQVESLSLADLDVFYEFTNAMVAGLPESFISALAPLDFELLIGGHVDALPVSVAGTLTLEQIQALSPVELAGFTLAQYQAMGTAQQQYLFARDSLIFYAESLEVGGRISYTSLLNVLESAAKGGMNDDKFAELEALASKLGVPGGIGASAYVAQIADDVINGNSANAYWNGGAATASALGDLTATSTQRQVQELIDKWFLGTDLPSLALPGGTGEYYPDQYEAENLPLFGPSGPSYLDVNQGDLGDCYFLAALGETAYLDPSLIENMIRENPNGTYSVKFMVDGNADYVTVNDELPIMLTQTAQNGSSMQFDNSPYLWSPLIEKAYAELMEQQGVEVGATLNVHQDSYAATSGGWGNGITAITGQSTSFYYASAFDGLNGGLASDLNFALAHHLDATVFTQGTASGNLVASHMYEVLQVNVAQQSVLLDNPWNGSGLKTGLQMQFWQPLSTLGAIGGGAYIANA